MSSPLRITAVFFVQLGYDRNPKTYLDSTLLGWVRRFKFLLYITYDAILFQLYPIENCIREPSWLRRYGIILGEVVGEVIFFFF